jgi:protein-S-isoprenylcysteine O-methyltransferase Ste14
MRRLSVAALVAMLLALVGLSRINALLASNTVGIAIQVTAVSLMIWARLAFGRRSFHASADPTPGGLVRDGPYRLIRHPIHAAACLLGCAGVATHWSLCTVLLGALLLTGALGRMLGTFGFAAHGEVAGALAVALACTPSDMVHQVY